MEWKILLTAVSIVFIVLLETETVCVGPQCYSSKERSAPINRKLRSDIVHCLRKCNCNPTLSIECVASDLFHIPTQGTLLQITRMLSLRHNRIRKISSGAFSHMKHLQFLEVIENQMIAIDSGAFKGLNELRMLTLSRNRIKRIPKNVFNGADLPLLVELSLRSNELESIESETFSNMTGLKRIYLNNNWITHISQDAFKGLTKLSALYLPYNLLTSAAWVNGSPSSLHTSATQPVVYTLRHHTRQSTQHKLTPSRLHSASSHPTVLNGMSQLANQSAQHHTLWSTQGNIGRKFTISNPAVHSAKYTKRSTQCNITPSSPHSATSHPAVSQLNSTPSNPCNAKSHPAVYTVQYHTLHFSQHSTTSSLHSATSHPAARTSQNLTKQSTQLSIRPGSPNNATSHPSVHTTEHYAKQCT
ncbi:leucine-rich repeat and immunoglobulin-like domain-containing nogo receptor-interacting protein 1 [Plakobranchus ocellatus]|uniref:Leucine-rich repeat and immunoglobulin-like domain-containing nogo receptor-interacting protein 1 n=1 Tax=Plakobranchus ocellatus TaxID=259542 RepID=A0AAV3ZB76_9GAST|nr:leucine-rich repeat and immunoglobulin-like domain-containing nogo receptor-interacting protein 1 [Plakobranchus ocellatus]